MLMDNKTLGKTLQVGVAIFLVMSLADLVLTWRLVSADNSEVDEINPVALWVLQNAGWTGLAAYKLTLASMIGVAAMMISRRKQIAGNSVIMFGCGAQASVVITGFLLLQGSKPHGNECLPEVMPDHRSSESYLGFPSDGYCLLVHASVQKELGLSAEYIQEFAEVTQKRRDLIRKMRTTNVCETYQDFHDLLVHEKIMGERLSPAQQKRLFEICLQARGALSLLDPVITESLNLDDDQIVEFANIRNYVLLHELAIVLSPTSARPQYKIEGDAVKVHARILSVLNAVQAAQWQTMQGEPFQFETLAAVTVSMPSEPAVE